MLSDLATTGVISPHAGHRYKSKPESNAAREVERQGVLSVNPRGFGFVASVGFDDDLYIPEDRMAGGMHGDGVTARLVARSSRGSEGEVVRVVSRAHRQRG